MKARAIDRPQTRAPSVIKGILAWIRYRLPEGRALPDRIWHGRHRGVRLLLWFHAAGLAVFGVLTGHGLVPSTLEGGAIAIAALLAGWTRRGRRFCAVVATIGLLTSSAVLVHFSGGYIEMHFHFFVMVGLITLYQDWTPFLLAIGYVVVHHGIMGALYPTSVYNHPAAWAHPWRWAAIHGVFVLAASVTNLIAWSLNEFRALHDPLTELANRALFRSRVERRWPRIRPVAVSPSCSSTSTISRRSTALSAMRPAINCWSKSRSAFESASAPQTLPPESVETSSPSCCMVSGIETTPSAWPHASWTSSGSRSPSVTRVPRYRRPWEFH